MVWMFLFLYTWNDRRDLIHNDSLEYYSYIPATFICGDISLEFKNGECYGRYWPKIAPNGGKVIKMSMGMAIVYTPFFLIGHATAYFLNESMTGYTPTYQRALALGSLFYLILGFVYLRKLLLNYFDDTVTGIVILLLYFATNLFYYSTWDMLMPHAFLFSFISIFLYLVHKFYQSPTKKTVIAAGLLLGLMALMRPTMILLFLVPALFGIGSIKELRERIQFFLKNKIYLILFAAAFILPWIPQFIYWKYVTGNWMFYSYIGERFYFLKSHIREGLFSYRKGWFVYTPVMFIALFGFFKIRKYCKDFALPFLIIVPLFVYVTLSWWCWWYGGSFGQRPFVDLYGIMAFPLAIVVSWILKLKRVRLFGMVVMQLLIVLNVFQSWQSETGMIHYEAMTKEAYWDLFGQTTVPPGFYDLLLSPNSYRAHSGLPERIRLSDVELTRQNIKACNGKFLKTENAEGTLLIADKENIEEGEAFTIKHLEGDKVILLGENHKYADIDVASGNALRFIKTNPAEAAVFSMKIDYRNVMCLKAATNNYVNVDPGNSRIVVNSPIRSRAALFQLISTE
ncbi:MAG: hypothetical protein JWP12_2385 [Bacteroidetes bacterium]|nr:hypothetical protein [Bacteroidota bacterium]